MTNSESGVLNNVDTFLALSSWHGFLAYCEDKKKREKIDSSHESVQNLYFSTWPKIEAIFCQIKASSHEINLLMWQRIQTWSWRKR